MSDLYFCGDVHGKYKELVWKLCEKNDIRDSGILVLGDFGIGFTRDMSDLYNKTEKKLEDRNLTIYVLRGNHDDPQYFTDEEKYSYPRLRFLEDHRVYNICDRSIYIIGGANSTDANIDSECTTIVDRKVETEERLREHKLPTWWEDEPVVEKLDDLPTRVDIIASHCAPLNFDPVLMRTSEISVPQFEKILEERKYLEYVLNEVRADYWFYGHYHKSYTGTYNRLIYRCLGELELYLAPEHKQTNPQGEII